MRSFILILVIFGTQVLGWDVSFSAEAEPSSVVSKVARAGSIAQSTDEMEGFTIGSRLSNRRWSYGSAIVKSVRDLFRVLRLASHKHLVPLTEGQLKEIPLLFVGSRGEVSEVIRQARVEGAANVLTETVGNHHLSEGDARNILGRAIQEPVDVGGNLDLVSMIEAYDQLNRADSRGSAILRWALIMTGTTTFLVVSRDLQIIAAMTGALYGATQTYIEQTYLGQYLEWLEHHTSLASMQERWKQGHRLTAIFASDRRSYSSSFEAIVKMSSLTFLSVAGITSFALLTDASLHGAFGEMSWEEAFKATLGENLPETIQSAGMYSIVSALAVRVLKATIIESYGGIFAEKVLSQHFTEKRRRAYDAVGDWQQPDLAEIRDYLNGRLALNRGALNYMLAISFYATASSLAIVSLPSISHYGVLEVSWSDLFLAGTGSVFMVWAWIHRVQMGRHGQASELWGKLKDSVSHFNKAFSDLMGSFIGYQHGGQSGRTTPSMASRSASFLCKSIFN